MHACKERTAPAHLSSLLPSDDGRLPEGRRPPAIASHAALSAASPPPEGSAARTAGSACSSRYTMPQRPVCTAVQLTCVCVCGIGGLLWLCNYRMGGDDGCRPAAAGDRASSPSCSSQAEKAKTVTHCNRCRVPCAKPRYDFSCQLYISPQPRARSDAAAPATPCCSKWATTSCGGFDGCTFVLLQSLSKCLPRMARLQQPRVSCSEPETAVLMRPLYHA